MRVAVFSTKPYDEAFLGAANEDPGHDLRFHEARLTPDTARLAEGCAGVCAFVNDDLSAEVLDRLGELDVKLVALRSAGYNNLDKDAASARGIRVARVPAYSPHSVAEHAAGLILVLNRKIHRAYNRVRENNLSLVGLLGFELHDKTVGVIGTGAIGRVFCRIMLGFGCKVVATDPEPNEECRRVGVDYVALEDLLASAEVISLHCPLTPDTRHLVGANALARMKDGVMLVNTSRGGLIDTTAAIGALKSGRLGSLGLDVYEEEGDLFFEDLSESGIGDDVFARLLTFPNVVVTGHQGFFTEEALNRIARTTIANLTNFERDEGEVHYVR